VHQFGYDMARVAILSAWHMLAAFSSLLTP